METTPRKRYERAHTNGKKTKSIHRQVQGQGGDGGGQGGKDLGRVGIGISGTSESDIRLEEAAKETEQNRMLMRLIDEQYIKGTSENLKNS